MCHMLSQALQLLRQRAEHACHYYRHHLPELGFAHALEVPCYVTHDICIQLQLRARTHTCTSVYLSIYLCIYLSIYLCIYIYIYAHPPPPPPPNDTRRSCFSWRGWGLKLYNSRIFRADKSKTPKSWGLTSKIPNFQIPKFQISKTPKFQISKFLGPNNSKIPNFQIPNFQIPKFQISKTPKFQLSKFLGPNNSIIPNFQNSKIPNFGGLTIPNFYKKVEFWNCWALEI